MYLPQHAVIIIIIVMIITSLGVLPLNALVLRYYRRKNIEWRDDIKGEINNISKEIGAITNSINNNISSALLPVLYEELQGLSNDTRIERSLWIYFRKKVSDVSESYYTLKNIGIETLRENGFANNLLGSGTMELILLNPDFPPEFTSRIDSINQKHYSDFLDAIFMEFNLNIKDDKIVIIKTVTIEYFRKNIKTIYQLYKDTKHLIISDDFVKMYGKQEKQLNVADNLNIEPKFLKDLISQGKKGVERAIKFMQLIITDVDKMNELSIYSARYFDFVNSKNMGINDNETELNLLRISLLEFIDKL